MRLKEAIDQYVEWKKIKVTDDSIRGMDRELKMFCLFARNPETNEITLNQIIEYLNMLKYLGWMSSSLARKSSALRGLFSFLRLQGFQIIHPELVPMPRVEKRLPRVLDDKTFEKFFKSIPENNDPRHIRNKSFVALLWDTGARIGELCSLNVKDLDMDKMKAVIKTEKARSRPFREIFWTKQANAYLSKWINRRKEMEYKFLDKEALFVGLSSVYRGRRMCSKSVGEVLRNYCERMKIPTINAHSFRHHLAHEIIEKGGSNADIVNILGHADVKSTTIYTMMFDRELEERYRKFKGY
jgi:site-specific recombinase XerD